MSESSRRILVPVLWGLMFLGVGLVGILIISPKYADRRARLDQQFVGRQRAMEATSDKALAEAGISPEPADQDRTALYFGGAILFGGSLLVGFAVYAFRQPKALQADAEVAESKDEPTDAQSTASPSTERQPSA